MDLSGRPLLIPLGNYQDHRGVMGILHDNQVPFEVRRIYWIGQVPENTTRGGHAHKTSKQLLICISGVIEVKLEDLYGMKQSFQLDALSQQGLYLPPLCWGHYHFKQQAMALCLASDYFEESDYIRNYREFRKLKNAY